MAPDESMDTDLLFARALELEGGAREEFLDTIRITHPDKESEVRSLIAANESVAPSFLELGPKRALSELASTPLGVGARVGPFRLQEELGRGGMGIVFRATRVEGGFVQDVAIKLARWGLSSGDLRRFDVERSILGQLTHPGIAHLYGGGVVGDRPYLVMELVDGSPITTHADRHGLSVRDRVRLVRSVCDAVAAAHQSLVIHRDLKPSNVLVAADGSAKLLDFGISALLPGSDVLGSVPADGSSAGLTPAYSAPELLTQEPMSTATDVYSLGVILYELLTGARPFEVEGLSPWEVRRLVCESEPEPPSAAAARAGKENVSKDLDAVVLRALAKDPSDRYGSALALANDLDRFFEGYPVVARAQTRPYRMSRYIRRNRTALASGLAVVVALLSGLGLTAWQARIAQDRAREAALERDLARAAATRAEAASDQAERINRFLQGVLATPNPSWYVPGEQKGPDVTVLSALDEAARRMDVELADHPEVRADIHLTLGDTYRALFDFERMVLHFEASLALRREAFEAPHPKLAEALYYASTAVGLGGEYARSEALLRDAIQMQRERDEGENLPFMLHQLSSYASMRGDAQEALSLAREATEVYVARHGPEHPYYRSGTRSMNNLAKAHAAIGDLGAAREWAEASLARSEDVHGLWARAVVDALDGRLDDAARGFMRALARSDELTREPLALRADYVELVLVPQGRFDEAAVELGRLADAWLERSEERPNAVLGRLRTLALHGYVAARAGDVRTAEESISLAEVEISIAVRPGDDAYFWSERLLLESARGHVALKNGDLEEAQTTFAANLVALEGRTERGRNWRSVHADLAMVLDRAGDDAGRDHHAALAGAGSVVR